MACPEPTTQAPDCDKVGHAIVRQGRTIETGRVPLPRCSLAEKGFYGGWAVCERSPGGARVRWMMLIW